MLERAQILRFLRGKGHPVDDELVLMLMAVLCLGGHHSLAETGLAVRQSAQLNSPGRCLAAVG